MQHITGLRLRMMDRNNFYARLKSGVIAKTGQLLAANDYGYELADNRSIDTIQGVIMAVQDSSGSEVLALASGLLAITEGTVGDNVYVGEAGMVVTTPPLKSGSWVKCVGTVVSSTQWRFEPDSFSMKNE